MRPAPRRHSEFDALKPLSAPLVGLVLAAALASSAAAAKPDAAKRAAVLDALSACRKEADSAQRLACYDKAAGALDEAEAKGQVVVLDREQVKTVKREAFGLSLPSFSLFAGRGGPSEDKVDRVAYVIDHAGHGLDGRWVFHTVDGVAWQQIDEEELGTPPHKGSELQVKRGALSSFFCKVDGQRALRCQRQH